MNLQALPIVLGILSGVVPIAAAALRGRSRMTTAIVVCTSVSISVYLLVLRQLVSIGPTHEINAWVHALIASAVPMLLSALLLSGSIGRQDPSPTPAAKKVLLGFGLVGAVFMALLRHKTFVSGYDWDVRGTVHLGPIGKAYISYLLVGVVWIGYNLEGTYRAASTEARYRLKLPFFGIFVGLGYATIVLSTGLLYSSLGLGKLVASGLPIALANVVIGYGFLRGTLTDVAAPVSRNIVYSSFTALTAGLYVFAVGLVAQVATYANWSPDEVLTVSFAFLTGLFALLLLVSNRFQRRVRRFIDRNFYVNRYDYRSQWSNVTRAFGEALTAQEVLPSAFSILQDIFHADEITIATRESASLSVRPALGKGAEREDLALEPATPLFDLLTRERSSLMLDRRAHDFEYIPVYAENRRWLDGTASQMVAPLFEGTELVGTLGLARAPKSDRFTFEDVALMDSIASHISSALLSARLTEELAEAREMQLMSQWSSMILHDLKNYLTPLRLVARNLVQYQDRENVAVSAATDLNQVADRMESFIGTLKGLRDNPQIARDLLDVNELIRTTLDHMQVERRAALDVQLDLQAARLIPGDEGLLRRVLENLVTNAIEAMSEKGTLSIRSQECVNGQADPACVQVSISDTGKGIPREFLKNKLFRPFATTKRGGMGLGLYQCRTIVRAHGGQLKFESQQDRGTTVSMILRADPDESAESPRSTDPPNNGAGA